MAGGTFTTLISDGGRAFSECEITTESRDRFRLVKTKSAAPQSGGQGLVKELNDTTFMVFASSAVSRALCRVMNTVFATAVLEPQRFSGGLGRAMAIGDSQTSCLHEPALCRALPAQQAMVHKLDEEETLNGPKLESKHEMAINGTRRCALDRIGVRALRELRRIETHVNGAFSSQSSSASQLARPGLRRCEPWDSLS